MSSSDCELCAGDGGVLLWRNPRLRVVRVEDPLYPGFCRVIWNSHVGEMTDLPPHERLQLMSAVFAAEQALREVLAPDKVNLASLGNLVPHLHWHVIPRWRDDPHFPAPVWAAQRRERTRELPPGLDPRLAAALAQLLG